MRPGLEATGHDASEARGANYSREMDVERLSEVLGLPDLRAHLDSVERRLHDVLRSETADLTEPSLRVTKGGGKRLRPILTIAAASAEGAHFDDHVVAGSASVELVHVGSLIHDDIFDRAATRRGVPTINSVEGDGRAVMAGDFVLARAGEEAASVSAEVAATLARTITQLCLGQHLETVHLHDVGRTAEQHFTSIEGKTASLLAASSRIGALCAGLTTSTADALADFGTGFGMSFQIVDDVLDMISNAEKLGKPVGNDIRSGVYTLPVILALAGPNGDELHTLLLDSAVSDDDIARAIKIISDSGAIDEAMAVSDAYVVDAVAALEPLPDTPVITGLRELPMAYRNWAIEALGAKP